MSGHEVYVGDGLYASFDGFMITLRAPREGGDHWIGLEPDVWRSLVSYRARLKREFLAQDVDGSQRATVEAVLG
jgi:hypothetical protein